MDTRKNRKKRFLKRVFCGLFLIIFLIAIIFFLRLFHANYWDGSHSLNLAVGGGGNVCLINFNPLNREITKINIPGNTEFQLARGLGVMQAKNIWRLGFNERLKGNLLSETLTKNMRMSVYTWADNEAEAFWDSGWTGLIKAVFKKYETNLSFGDRFKIAIFAYGVKEYKRTEINLSETALLTKTKLNDGGEGYVLSGRFPKILYILASDARLADKKVKIKIIDSTGEKGIAESLGKIIESLGAKITLLEEGGKKEGDCTVYSNNKEIKDFLKVTFDCKTGKILTDGSFDIEIFLGKDFAKRF